METSSEIDAESGACHLRHRSNDLILTRPIKTKAITAMAHMLARLVYRMLRYGDQYVDKGMNYYEEKYRDHQIRSIQKKAKELGLEVTLCPAA
jgi:hypothetical protein